MDRKLQEMEKKWKKGKLKNSRKARGIKKLKKGKNIN